MIYNTYMCIKDHMFELKDFIFYISGRLLQVFQDYV